MCKKTFFLIILILIVVIVSAGCRKNNQEVKETTNMSTTVDTTVSSASESIKTTTQTEEKKDLFQPLDAFVLQKSDQAPNIPSENTEYAFDIAHENARVIGYDYSVYLIFKDEYYKLLEYEAPVMHYGNAFLTDANGDGTGEIFIYDFASDRSAMLVYDKENDKFLMYMVDGLLYFNDHDTSQGYLLYSYQKTKYPYKLWLYKFIDKTPAYLEVTEKTGSEYAVMAEGKYIFAGDRDRIFMYFLRNDSFIRYDDRLYMTSRIILPDADKKILKENELDRILRFDIEHAIDRILSVNGYIFEDEYLNYYFEIFPWYIADHDFTADMLNDFEKINIELIMDYLNKLDSNVSEYESMYAYIDLNNDTIIDSIELEIEDNEFVLTINDKTVKGFGEMLIEKLFIVDIDNSDDYLEVGISEAGPSNDYATHFYRYDGSNIIFLGRIEGAVFDMSFTGDGRILSYKRGSILHTWFYPYMYIIEDDTLMGIDADEYVMNTFVVLKEGLDVYANIGDIEPAFTIRADRPALIVASDDKSYCRIRISDDQEGFFYVSGVNNINNTGIDSGSFFNGLSFAD